jgi:hypothetical protein
MNSSIEIAGERALRESLRFLKPIPEFVIAQGGKS